MSKGSGGGGASTGGGGRNNTSAPGGEATGGKTRTIGGKKFNTADVVNNALADTRASGLSQNQMDKAKSGLERLGHKNPSAEIIRDYATQAAVLDHIQSQTGANTSGQVGRWNFKTPDTIQASMNSYLNRRISGQHQRWTERTGGG